MTAKEYDGVFSDGAYVVGFHSSANYGSAILSALFRSSEKNCTYLRRYAKIWKRNNIYYYRIVNELENSNGYVYTRNDGLPSPFCKEVDK